MNKRQETIKNPTKMQSGYPVKEVNNRTQYPNVEIDEMLTLLRNRAVVELLRDEEALRDIDSFERCVQPPGNQALARIEFGLKEILDEKSAEVFLAFLDRHSWNFRFSLSLRDFRQTFYPHWLFCLFLFYLLWLILLFPFTYLLPDVIFFKTILGICGMASVLTLCIYYEFKERKRLQRVNSRHTRIQQANNYFQPIPPHPWMND